MKHMVSGLAGGGKAWYILEHIPAGAAVLAVVPEEDFALWEGNLCALAAARGETIAVCRFPSGERFERLSALRTLSENPHAVIITSPEAAAASTFLPSHLKDDTVSLISGNDYPFNSFMDTLARLGYQRLDFVEEKGQFSRRGEILDIWSADQQLPWRLVFNQSTLESIKTFDVVTQRSESPQRRAELLPAREAAEATIDHFLPEGSFVYYDRTPEEDMTPGMSRFDSWVNDPLSPAAEDAGFKSFTRWAGNFRLFVDDLLKFTGTGFRTVIIAANAGDKERVEDVLCDQGWRGDMPDILIGPLAEGFFSTREKIAFFSSQEILYRRRPVSFPRFKAGRRLEGLWEMSPGDYVVHEKYGIGRYLGLRKISRGEQEAEYLCIEYRGGDKLYVPPDDFRVVQKYVGVEGYRPKLYSLDTGAWERAKQRASKGAQELAEELLKLYAARHNTPGHAYTAGTPWERELADSFAYEETADQMRAIEDVSRDLERTTPMDRVICGDVGFGKTEVAIRAAFKVAQDSKQVAVLVPTTVLAEQHYQTFTNRLSAFPTRIGLLSRFQTRADQNIVVEGVRSGQIDIVIGTHRLLQKDVSFKDLGLLIIDEEHRFGVRQKEKIKSMKHAVDVLLLSATPIPRTLSLSLSGMRDLSVIETPPYGRLPIETHLSPFDESAVKRIIQAELSRNGQVYYVHNRVETIYGRAHYLKTIIPDVRWGVIHGQMPSREIEKTMWQFLHREIDVLVATTIIESGLDIPSVNTMIVEEAENFGLAQLYQLRGRIGREKQKAYCYLFYTPELLTDDSRKRLEALQEFDELGAGFRLALRDLEIRGAGNILSGEQHGFVKEIGFELYSRLIEEASQGLRGKPAAREKFHASMDFDIAAFIPTEYIGNEDIRIIFYRRLAEVTSMAELKRIREELEDRFGPLPLPIGNLFQITELRCAAERLRISRIAEEDGGIVLCFPANADVPPEAVLRLAHDYEGRIEFLHGEIPGFRFRKQHMPQGWNDFLKEFFSYFSRILESHKKL